MTKECPHEPSFFITLGNYRYQCGQCGVHLRWEGTRADGTLKLIVESKNGTGLPGNLPCRHPHVIQANSAEHKGQNYCLDCRTYQGGRSASKG